MPPVGQARGVVLACHGGSGHKTSNAILMIVEACRSIGTKPRDTPRTSESIVASIVIQDAANELNLDVE